MPKNLFLIVLALRFFGMQSASAEALSDDVRLLTNVAVPMAHYGMSWQISQTRVLVKDRGPDKKVEIVFEHNGKETRVPASYLGPAEDGFEVWEAYGNLDAGESNFHVEYSVDGESFTDDNEGRNFPLQTGATFYHDQSIEAVLTGKDFYDGYAKFTAALRSDLGYEKKVQVHYSFDAFLSENVLDMSFKPDYYYGYGSLHSPSKQGSELWEGHRLNIPAEVSSILYYLSYDVGGRHFEDRNFGHYYEVKRDPHESTLLPE